MRITTDMMVARSVRRLSDRLEGYERVQQQVATGKRFTKPSEQPADANTGMALRAARRAREQQQRAAADAESWLGVVDMQMQSAVERLHRVRDLAIGVNPSLSPAEALAVQTEMRGIQDELVAIANARHRGQPVFGGFIDGPAVSGSPGAWSFHDDGGQVLRRVGAEDVLRVNVTATEAFTIAGGDDVFTVIDDLVAAVGAGGGAPVSDLLPRLDAALAALGEHQGRVGATGARLAAAQDRGMAVDLALRTELAKTEDTDVAEAIMELQVQQLGFEATLKAVGTALPPSLISFL